MKLPTRCQAGASGWRSESGERRHAEVEPAVALAPSPQHQLDEQVVHGAARRVGAEAHQVHRQLRRAYRWSRDWRRPAGAPSARTSASGNCRRYCGENAPTEKRFSPVDLAVSQASEMRCRAGSSRRDALGRHHLEAGPVALRRGGAPGADRRARAPSSEKSRERHARLLADLQCREPEVDVQRRDARRSPGRTPSRAPWWSDISRSRHTSSSAPARAPTGSPSAIQLRPRDLVHEEGVAGVAEQQALVAGERGVGDGRVAALR